jgi:hypothetical protein
MSSWRILYQAPNLNESTKEIKAGKRVLGVRQLVEKPHMSSDMG